MSLNVLRIRRAAVEMGANDEQADEFADALGGLVTADDMHQFGGNLEARIVNRILLAMIALTGINIGAVALIVHL